MKKRKGGDAEEGEISAKKSKVSGFAERNENNNKPSEVLRTVKGLLQKEQTRLSGVLACEEKMYFQLYGDTRLPYYVSR